MYFLKCFDVFVHVDMHTFYQSLMNIKPMMSDTTLFFVSVANIISDLGFDRFKKQKTFKVSGSLQFVNDSCYCPLVPSSQ